VNVRFLAATLAVALAAGARAQDRPSEDELFGKPPGEKAAPERKPAPQPPAPGDAAGQHGETESELFGSKSAPNAPPAPSGSLISREREDWLKIGGLLQMRGEASAYQDAAPRNWPFSSPNLLDLYLDARPNDRVRGFVLGRMSWDPTVRSSGASGSLSAGAETGGTSGAGGFGGVSTTANPGALLDQMWVNFDVEHRAFVTAGRQHVKWGVGRFWNPTDYLHPIRRDPLATFDARTGTTLVKVHVPWEKRGWNLYGIALFEDLAGDGTRTASRLGRIGGGGRAEIVLGSGELGLDAMFQDGHRPRYGVDVSAGAGDFDLYSEVALRNGGDGPRWTLQGTERPAPDRLTPQVVAGATWAYKYSDEDSLSVGAEYFYNDLGYDDRRIYPFLLAGAPRVADVNGQPTVVQQDTLAFQPFYLGKHYGAVNLSLPRPGRWNDATFILSVLGNLSDRSYVARLDASVLVLTYMTVETFVAGHFGQKGGEFRLALGRQNTALAQQFTGQTFPAGAPIVDVGVALRVSL
jgi:hypothetical protein